MVDLVEGEMGWHDDEEHDWLPEWAITPTMWIGCLLVAVVPATMVSSLMRAVLHQEPVIFSLLAYAVSAVLMIAAVKPWTVR